MSCPRCGQTIAEGYIVITVPVFWFLGVTVHYSPRCGYLKIGQTIVAPGKA